MKTTLDLIYTAIGAAVEKKGENIVLLDLQELFTITDYFLIITSQTSHHTSAIVESIDEVMSKEGLPPIRIEGEYEGGWVILDYKSFVIHIMEPGAREFYNLERLWARAKKVNLPDELLVS
ncbi:MAG TPA: ribosome silencing factor [bacterium]|nr:ribosome silencing factor [bacterium]